MVFFNVPCLAARAAAHRAFVAAPILARASLLMRDRLRRFRVGFGSFQTRQRQARTGRNPKTGEAVKVPAKRVAFFKPSKELKQLIQGA